jgi:hypothetical protein
MLGHERVQVDEVAQPVGGVLGGAAVAALGLVPALVVSGSLCLLLTVAPLFRHLVPPVAAGRVRSR